MEILIILFLLVMNGIFSMSEIAIVSARKSRLEAAAKRGDRKAQAALETSNSPNRFLSTVQIGITLIGILTGIFSGEKITEDLHRSVASNPTLQPYAHTIAVTIVVIIITFFSLVIGELVPKRIGLTNPEGIARVVARPMQILGSVTAPFVWLLTITSDLLIRAFRIRPSTESRVTEEEIKAIIQEGTEGGAIQAIEQDIMERVFSMGDRKISSLMTHRSDTIFLPLHATAAAIREVVNNEMHSCYPVYEDDKDTVEGLVLLKDLFRHIDEPGFRLSSILQKPQYISENIPAYEVLKMFKTSHIHYGIVTDEFGQMQGLVTMNDLLEALVGDVSEFYSSEFAFVEREDGSFLVDGQYPLPDFLRRFDLDEFVTDYPVNTLGGLFLHELRLVPQPGQKIQWMSFEMEVMDMDGARIDKILVKRIGE